MTALDDLQLLGIGVTADDNVNLFADGNLDGVVDAATGKLLQELDLSGRVTECGLAAAGGCLYASCEDGGLVCLGGNTPGKPGR